MHKGPLLCWRMDSSCQTAVQALTYARLHPQGWQVLYREQPLHQWTGSKCSCKSRMWPMRSQCGRAGTAWLPKVACPPHQLSTPLALAICA